MAQSRTNRVTALRGISSFRRDWIVPFSVTWILRGVTVPGLGYTSDGWPRGSAGKMLTIINASPMEFRRRVAQVANNHGPGVTRQKIAADFCTQLIAASGWLIKADSYGGLNPGITSRHSAELRVASKRIRHLDQEAEYLKRALAFVLQGVSLGKVVLAPKRARYWKDFRHGESVGH